MDKDSLKELQDALAEAARKFSPDRTALPIPNRTFGGTIGHTVDQSVADWTIVPGPKAPDDAPNVLIVLIDDAGFGRSAAVLGQPGVEGAGLVDAYRQGRRNCPARPGAAEEARAGGPSGCAARVDSFLAPIACPGAEAAAGLISFGP